MNEEKSDHKSVVALIAGVLIGGLLIWVFTPTPQPLDVEVSLIKTWNIEETHVLQKWNVDESKEVFAPIGNGLYEAIRSCEKQGGITSVEGARKAMLACYANDTTYYLVDFKWFIYTF